VGQLEHVESDIAPDVIEYLPAAHSVQLLDEAEDENDPGEHERQVEAVEAPVDAECVPASQLVQTVEAVPAAYLPVPQRVQTDASAAEYVPVRCSAKQHCGPPCTGSHGLHLVFTGQC
jgi:hypothetical protein